MEQAISTMKEDVVKLLTTHTEWRSTWELGSEANSTTEDGALPQSQDEYLVAIAGREHDDAVPITRV